MIYLKRYITSGGYVPQPPPPPPPRRIREGTPRPLNIGLHRNNYNQVPREKRVNIIKKTYKRWGEL